MSFKKEYQESLELIEKLERILELKKRESTFKSKKVKKKIEKEKDDLKDILNKSEEEEVEIDDSLDYEKIKEHDKVIKDFIENKDDLSEAQIQEKLEAIAEEAPEGWEPTDQLRDFYKDLSKNNGVSTDLNTVASLFLGVDKSEIEQVRSMTMSGYGLFVRLMKKIYPEEYYETIDNLYQKVLDKIPERYMSLYVKKFTKHAGGTDELTKKLIQIGTKDDNEGQIEYSGGMIEIGPDHSFDARIDIAKAMSLATWDVLAVSTGFGSEEDETYVSTKIQFPLKDYSRISSDYGMRFHKVDKVNKMHHGIDIAAKKGNYIYPIMKGVVTKKGYDSGRGNWIEIDHQNGYSSRYLHCTSIYLKKNDLALLDTIIASVGSTGKSTGPHLHLEVRKDGHLIDPMEVLKDLL